MIEVLFVAAVAAMGIGFSTWAVWTRVHASAEQVQSTPLPRADRQPTTTDTVAAGGLRASFPAATANIASGTGPRLRKSRGIDRVPDRFRDRWRAPKWIVQHQYDQKTGQPIKARPYRNPDRVQRLAKNGRLRPDLPPG